MAKGETIKTNGVWHFAIIKEVVNEFIDVLLEADAQINSLIGHQGFDVVGFAQIFRIINKNLHTVFIPAQGNPDIIKQKRFFKFADQLKRNKRFDVKVPERTSEIHR